MKEWQKQFEKKFPCIQGDCDGSGHIPVSEDESYQCEFHGKYLIPIKDFIQNLLDKRTKEIVDSVPMREIMFKPVCGLTNIYYTPTNDIKNWKESIKKKYEKL